MREAVPGVGVRPDPRFPYLRHVVVLSDRATPETVGWHEMLESGRGVSDDTLRKRAGQVDPEQTAFMLLWDDDVGPPGHTIEYRKIAAYESRAACFHAAEGRARRLLGKTLQIYIAPDETWMADSVDGRTGYTAQCWPDTAEPSRAGKPSHLK